MRTFKVKPTNPIQVVIRVLFLLTTLLISQACQSTETPSETNYILLKLVETSGNKSLLNVEMADNLKDEFQIPITMEQLLKPPFFSDYRQDIVSMISKSDINSWNKKLNQYRAGIFDSEHVERIPSYAPETGKILNSEFTLSDFDHFVTVSIPFMNASENKALLYVEYFSNPEPLNVKNSFLFIMKKQDGTWKEIYRKLLVVTS